MVKGKHRRCFIYCMSTEMLSAPGRLSDEFVNTHEGIWIPLYGRNVVDGCSDDRPPTQTSAQQINARLPENTMPIDEGYASNFGGFPALRKLILQAGVVEHGDDFIYSSDCMYGIGKTIAMYRRGLTMQHSTIASEDSPATFNPTSSTAVGCLYSQNFGAATFYLAPGEKKSPRDQTISDTVLAVAHQDQAEVFGENEAFSDKVGQAYRAMSNFLSGVAQASGQPRLRGDARDYTFDRQDYVDLERRHGTQTMILGSFHASIETTGLITNFDTDSVGSATIAKASGTPLYRQDLGVTARNLAPVLAEYGIPAETFLRVALFESTIIRAVLAAASGDSRMDPNRLAMGVRGDASEAIEYVDQLIRKQ